MMELEPEGKAPDFLFRALSLRCDNIVQGELRSRDKGLCTGLPGSFTGSVSCSTPLLGRGPGVSSRLAGHCCLIISTCEWDWVYTLLSRFFAWTFPPTLDDFSSCLSNSNVTFLEGFPDCQHSLGSLCTLLQYLWYPCYNDNHLALYLISLPE